MPLPSPREIPDADDGSKFEIRCNEAQEEAWKQMLADIGSNLSHREAMMAIYERYYQNPSDFG